MSSSGEESGPANSAGVPASHLLARLEPVSLEQSEQVQTPENLSQSTDNGSEKAKEHEELQEDIQAWKTAMRRM